MFTIPHNSKLSAQQQELQMC